MQANVVTVPVRTVKGNSSETRDDFLAVEEPLQLRVSGRDVSVTMRTPGHDFELAAGFLFTEGLLESPTQIAAIEHSGPESNQRRRGNTVTVTLQPGFVIDLDRLQRNFYATSSCGVCGKASIEALDVLGCPRLPVAGPPVSSAVIHQLGATLKQAQPIFERTGSLHAAALFDPDGRLVLLREDVGRHNALDKLIGAEFLAGRTPLSRCILLVSGRVSFELVQKAVVAGIPVLVAVGAPSSLAVEAALRFQMTLIGFARNGRFNVYSAPARIAG